MDRPKAPIIGIVGGIASGKTLVSEQFARHGASVVSADALAHEVLKYDEVKQKLRSRFGEAIFQPDGEVDRAALAKIVFAPTKEGMADRKYLEQLVHPEVGRLAMARVERLVSENAVPAIVLDVPLMLEAGWNEFCDSIVYIDAPREARLKRAQSRGWTAEDFERREAAQESLDAKRASATAVVDNSGSVADTQAEVDRVWRALVDERAARKVRHARE